MAKGTCRYFARVRGQQGLPAAGRSDQQDVRLLDFDVVFDVLVQHQPLVVVVHGDGQDFLRLRLADHVLIEVVDDLPRRRDVREEFLRRSAPAPLLVEDRLAKVDAFATDVDVFRPFNERSDVAIAFAAERTVRVFLGRGDSAYRSKFFPRGHASSFRVADRARKPEP